MRGSARLPSVAARAAVWRDRLTTRKYSEAAAGLAEPGFSVRLEHGNHGAYFPLGTRNENAAAALAAALAAELEQTGWVGFCAKHPREFAAAVFWLDRPVACTYATFFTGVTTETAPPKRTEARRVYLVEPDDGIRRSLARWVGRQPGNVLGGCAPHASGACADPRLAAADVVLFNRFLPDAASEEFLRRIRHIAPQAHAFSLGVFAESDDIFKSVGGVNEGYYLRRRPPESLLDPMDGAWGAKSPTAGALDKHLRGYFLKLLSGETRDASADGIRFTGREQQILHCLSRGMPDKEIAQQLGMSPLTVHTHLKHIFEKLGAHTRTEAVMKYLQK